MCETEMSAAAAAASAAPVAAAAAAAAAQEEAKHTERKCKQRLHNYWQLSIPFYSSFSRGKKFLLAWLKPSKSALLKPSSIFFFSECVCVWVEMAVTQRDPIDISLPILVRGLWGERTLLCSFLPSIVVSFLFFFTKTN